MSAEHVDIKSILDDLVHQFADPLAFFREVVQNSIDAGTGEIEITLSHDVERNTAEIAIADWGEGMNRHIIETKLTRLFSSGKDDDLTKIGRFGIGFVSVFAIAPEMVVIDTGRDGQFWRVIFNADRTYELYALEMPVEGTLVRIFKNMDGAAFERLKRDAERVIVTWCKHASVPIYFEGRDVRRPFEIVSHCALTHEEQGTRIVMGYVDPFEGFVGYYNRGLTLREATSGPWPYVSYKIDSRYLEHTLTRDQIIEDGHFQKAYGILRRMATDQLPEALIDRLEALSHDPTRFEEYAVLMGYLANYLSTNQRFKRPWRRRRLFVTASGEVTSLVVLERAARRKRLYLVTGDGPLARELGGRFELVRNTGNDAVGRVLRLALDQAVEPIEGKFMWLAESDDGAKPLILDTAMALLEAIGSNPARLRFADLRLTPEEIRTRFGCLVPMGAKLVDLDREVSHARLGSPERSRMLVIDDTDASMRELIGLHEREPEWAAMTLIKLVYAADVASLRYLDELVSVAVASRQARLGRG
jgi:molecular chaperone HtpG